MARDDDELLDDPEEEADEVEDDEEPVGGRGLGFLAGVVLGVLLGAGTALLLAPERGDIVRRRIGRGVRRLRNDAEDKMGELRDDAEHELRRARRRLRRIRRD